MTTFGLPSASISFESDQYAGDDASKPVPKIDVVPADDSRPLSNSDSGLANKLTSEELDDLINQAACHAEEYPLVATQPLTQSQPRIFDPECDQHLVGSLIPATGQCEAFELSKSQPDHVWRIGRHRTNDFVLSGLRLSNFHCTIRWNGKLGKDSEVILIDSSSNGTWVNNISITTGGSAILRGGAAISFGARPDDNYWRYIFRDIEGHSVLHMKNFWAKYDMGRELGYGAFARVHKCIERTTGEEYAVKIINRAHLRRSRLSEQAVVREIEILKQLAKFRHDNIVTLREHFEEEDAIYLILELVRGGDLLTYIGKHGALEEQQVRRMAAQICHAVAYIHSQGIAHRDLKPENVMITNDPSPDCKVADFGLAKIVDNGTFLKTMCGTPAYLAPEVMLRPTSQAYDNRVDSWSLGVILFCMLTGHSPFHEPYDPNATHVEQQRYFGSRMVDWSLLHSVGLSDDGHSFLRQLLAEDPRNRKTVAAMLDHHWISMLLPRESQVLPHIPDPPRSSSPEMTPTPTDGVVAFSQSLSQLNLSDIPIPGLSHIEQTTAHAAPPPGKETQSLEDVTARIPGAYPRAPGEANAESPTLKRKNNLIEGSSPLSPLSDEEPEPEPEPPKRTRKAAEKRRGAAGAARAPRRATTMPRRESSPEEVPRRSTRRHAPPAKAPRYA